MIERVKSFVNTARDYLIYVLSPVIALGALIWFLLMKQRTLKDKISELTRDERQKELEGKVREDEKDVAHSTGEYTRLRDQYLAEHGPGSDVPGSAKGSGSDDRGPGQDDR